MKIPAEVVIDPDFWAGRRVLVTGHTGFKGGWLALWLQALGADVSGLSRGARRAPSLFDAAGVARGTSEQHADVCDAAAVRGALGAAAPEIVFHLAAEPTVRGGLRDPRRTFAVNVMGAVNVLDAVRTSAEQVRAVVLVSSDRCYERPAPSAPPLVESAPLGGSDPYSSSKACAELVAAAYRRSYFSREGAPAVATARGGSVIGGGDWGEGRLLADAMRAVQRGRPLAVHAPWSSRPWQHVLDSLCGYLLLARALWHGRGAARAWNFAPPRRDVRAVGTVVEQLEQLWGGALRSERDEHSDAPAPAPVLLDAGAAERELGWRPVWDLERALGETVKWHRAHMRGADMRSVSLRQIERFTAAA